jgi:hypothetical protein
MSDLIKKRRKTSTKFLRLDRIEEEYGFSIDGIVGLLKDAELEAFGLFNNDFTISEPRDKKHELDIGTGTWRGNYGWKYDVKRSELINSDTQQSIENIRVNRRQFEKVVLQHYDPQKVKARIYNWELVITQICIYLHNKEVPKSKKAWLKQIFDGVPYFKTAVKPEYKAMEKHLGIIWRGLNGENIDWKQWVGADSDKG